MSYSYADNEYTFKDFPEVNFPNNLDITHSVFLGSSFTAHNFKISTGFSWHTGKPTTKPKSPNPIIENRINYNAANSSRIKDYIRIDASVIYKFNLTHKIKAQSGISILNSLNRTNTINNYYTIDNNAIKEVSKKALLFTPNFSFRVFF